MNSHPPLQDCAERPGEGPSADSWTAQDESQRLVDLGDKHADDPAPHTLKDLTREQRERESAFRKGWITESARRSAVRLRLVLKDLDTDSDLDSYARRNLPSHLKQVIERLEHDVEKVTSDTPIYQTVEELDRIAKL